MHIMGGGGLIRSLMGARVIDEYSLMIQPLARGSDRRPFHEGSPTCYLELVEAVPSTTRVDRNPSSYD